MKMIPKGPLRGEITVPGDKSISPQCIAGCTGRAEPGCRDSWRRLIVWPQLIACAYWSAVTLRFYSAYRRSRLGKLQEPGNILDCGNSGTTAR